MEYILVGKIVNTFGIKGELKVEIHTDFVDQRFREDSIIYIGENHDEYICKSYRVHQGFVLLCLKDKDDINLVLHLKNNNIYIKAEDLKPLDDGYYYKDLMNLDVFFDNTLIGKVIDIEDGLASRYLRIKTDDKSKLIPILPQFIKKIDLDNKRIDIFNMEGYL